MYLTNFKLVIYLTNFRLVMYLTNLKLVIHMTNFKLAQLTNLIWSKIATNIELIETTNI